MDLLQLLQSQLGGGAIDQLSQQIGASPEQTSTATESIISTLLGGLSKNAATPEGASNLFNALEKDHDGSLLDNLSGFLGGNVPQSSATNGLGILQHILGGNQGGAVDMISKLSGLNGGQAGNLMAILAPILMGTLGKAKNQGGLDMNGIASLLTNNVNSQASNPMMKLATQFLDKNGDGSIMDDLAGMVGNKILGGLFKR